MTSVRPTGAYLPAAFAAPRAYVPSTDPVDHRLVQSTLVFLILHLPLGFAIQLSPSIATLHLFGVALFALSRMASVRSLERMLPTFAYIAASEPLWRVGRAMAFYESAKYMLAGLSLVALFRFPRKRQVSMPALYFLLFLPSLLALPYFDRKDISFNLSGPFSLALTTYCLCRIKVSPAVLRQTFTAVIGPVAALAIVGTFSTLTTEHINFYNTKVASGGLGQNQASSLFGLGALMVFLYISLLKRQRVLTFVFAILGVWFIGQAALTFSRGGVATTVGAAMAATFFLSLDSRFRGAAVLRVVLALFVASLFLVPTLDSVTSGQLTQRFSSSSLTGRDKIIEADLLTFQENPILGVGPGQSYLRHARTFRASSAHTEYSRLLAEHGMFGAMALLLLLIMSGRWVLQQTDAGSRAFSAALVTWSLLYMFHQAMRMAAVSFMFALASTYLVRSQDRWFRVVRRGRDGRLWLGSPIPAASSAGDSGGSGGPGGPVGRGHSARSRTGYPQRI